MSTLLVSNGMVILSYIKRSLSDTTILDFANMGQAASAVRAAAKSTNGENEKMVNDSLNAMGSLAREKMKNFRLKVTSNSDTHEVPVDKLISTNYMICCSVSEDDKNIKQTVTDLCGNIVSGKFLDALVAGANAMISALFGSTTGNESEYNSYKISVGNLGGIVRLDAYLYMYKFSSETMINLTKNVVVVCVAASSVDPTALDVATLRVAIQQTYGEDIQTARKLLSDVLYEWNSEKKMLLAGTVPVRPIQDSTTQSPSSESSDDLKRKKPKVDDKIVDNSIRRDPQGPGNPK